MEETARPKGDPILNKRLIASILSIASILTLVLLGLFFCIKDQNLNLIRSTLLTALVVLEFVRVANIRKRGFKLLYQ